MIKTTMEEILISNPKIDSDKLGESMKVTEALRRLGVKPRGYRLAPAFGGRRAIAVDRRGKHRQIELSKTTKKD